MKDNVTGKDKTLMEKTDERSTSNTTCRDSKGIEMTRFATLDMNSGYIWWSGNADSATDACVKSHACTGNYRTEWAEISRSEINSTANGYAVYQIPDDLSVDDGQDADTITAVTASPLSGYFRRTQSQKLIAELRRRTNES